MRPSTRPAGNRLPPKRPPGFADILDHPEAFLEECGEEVYAAMQEVSEAQRACLLLRVAEQLSYKEIAEVLDIPVGTVMTHLSRGRGRLRNALADYAAAQGLLKGGANDEDDEDE